jgi:uncharacterized delta-60 repeat protein
MWKALCGIFLTIVLAAYGQAGRIDPTFRARLNNAVNTLRLQSDGKILIGGRFTSVDGKEQRRLARLYNDGRLDTNFIADADGLVRQFAVDSCGKILVRGEFNHLNGEERFYFARLNSDGSLDHGFDGHNLHGAMNIGLQSTGQIIIDQGIVLYRLQPQSGNIDATFNVKLNSGGYFTAVYVLTDDSILIAGNFNSMNGVAVNDVARLTSEGLVDPSFDTWNINLGVWSQCILPQGEKVLVGGSVFTRLTSAGGQDTAFAYAADNPPRWGRENALALQRDDKIWAAGELHPFDSLNTNLIRYLPNGSVDPSFNTGLGPVNADIGYATVYSMIMQPDQRVLIGGDFTDYDGSGQQFLVRVLNDWPVLETHSLATNRIELRWPSAYSNFSLQSAPDLYSAVWSDVLSPPVIHSNVCFVTNVVNGSNAFYRLRRQ